MFGDGEDYNWALELDDEVEQEDYLKQDMKYQDVGLNSHFPKTSHPSVYRFSSPAKFDGGS